MCPHPYGVDGFSAPHVRPKQDVLISSPALSRLSRRRWATTMGWQSQALLPRNWLLLPKSTSSHRCPVGGLGHHQALLSPTLGAPLALQVKDPPTTWRQGCALGSSSGSGVILSKYEPWLCPRLATLTFTHCKMMSRRVPSYGDI